MNLPPGYNQAAVYPPLDPYAPYTVNNPYPPVYDTSIYSTNMPQNGIVATIPPFYNPYSSATTSGTAQPNAQSSGFRVSGRQSPPPPAYQDLTNPAIPQSTNMTYPK